MIFYVYPQDSKVFMVMIITIKPLSYWIILLFICYHHSSCSITIRIDDIQHSLYPWFLSPHLFWESQRCSCPQVFWDVRYAADLSRRCYRSGIEDSLPRPKATDQKCGLPISAHVFSPTNAFICVIKKKKKKQDEAHEPECRHVCWVTETILICHIFQRTHLWDTLTWHTEATLL